MICEFMKTHNNQKIGRNQPCPCGSGKKFKQCCGMSNKKPPPVLSQPSSVLSLPKQAFHYHQTGQLQKAEELYRQILQTQPNLAEIHNNLGVVLQAQNKLEEAEVCFRQVIKLKPEATNAHNNLGNLLQAQDKLEEAEVCYRQALVLKPDFADAHNNLGNVLKAQKKLREALSHYQEALIYYRNVLNSELLFRLYNHIGEIFYQLKKFEEAANYYGKAVKVKPDAKTFHAFGRSLHAQEKFDQAKFCYRKAVEIQPDFAEAHHNLGRVLQVQKQFEEALICYRKAIEFQPNFAAAYSNIGSVLQAQGQFDEAKWHYQQALTLEPNNASVTIRLAIMLPIIMRSQSDILDSRHQFDQNLTELLNSDIKFDQDPFQEGGVDNFYLVYHGLNDRELQIKLATLYEQACPSLLYTAPHCQTDARSGGQTKIKIGFISKFFRNHTIGKVMRGIIANLSRDKFHIHLFLFPQQPDEISQWIQAQADSFETLPLLLEEARLQIANQQLDILFYPDIGMDPFTYFLAFARLAPVQCVTWGHPMTTGIRHLDYFISTHDLEVDTGEEHYSEKLIRLNSTLTFYYKPTFPTPLKARSYFGLEDKHHIYLIPQNLFKFHPDFDPILANILYDDPDGQIILVEGHHQSWAEQLKNRFLQNIPEVIERIRFVPRQNFNDYLNLIAISDVLLDTLHFGGGNTSYEALSIGKPIVTLPSKFLRGRITYACYRKMGIMDCVAENPQHYVKIAVRLGTDMSYREQLKARILAASHLLYEDISVVWELEQFLVEAWTSTTD
jgi:protein O-GlcNAc transferase